MSYDFIIVGAGSAGCPLAARLSEDGTTRVLLLDAGPFYRFLQEFPAELRDAGSMASSTPGHPNNWSFMGNVSREVSYPIPRGKVFGGSSAINATVFNRGTPDDFDGWAALGHDQWSFDKVLPFYRRLEADRDFHDDNHGAVGPVPVERPHADDLGEDQRAFLAACAAEGFPASPDKNAPDANGFGLIPLNAIGGQRMNAAICYLTAEVLARPNLTVGGDIFVRRVLFDRQRAVGVEAEQAGKTTEIYGGEIILSSGAIKSAHLLMLSGIGPAKDLRARGIAVLKDMPGVGRGFMDHPTVVVSYSTAKPIPEKPALPQVQTSLNYTATGSPIHSDMEIFPFCRNVFGSVVEGDADASGLWTRLPAVLRHPLRTLGAMRGTSLRRLFNQYQHRSDRMMACILNQPEGRGEILLKSSDPHVQPELNYYYFENETDRRRMREAVRLAVRLLQGPAFGVLGTQVTNPLPDDLATDEALDVWLMRSVLTAYHMAASCPMGDPSDAHAVVDQYCRVHGVENLRVVDTSIQPKVVRRAANATAIMIGERAAELIRAMPARHPHRAEALATDTV